MTYLLKIIDPVLPETQLLSIEENTLLLNALRLHDIPFHAPCNGNGLCRKCLIHVRGLGDKLACQFRITQNLEVVLPKREKASILTENSLILKEFPFHPGFMKIRSDHSLRLFYGDQFLENLSEELPFIGLAIDIGTTTVALYLHDLSANRHLDTAAFLNPQHSFGQDVISRIQFTLEKEDGLTLLRERLISTLNDSLGRLFDKHRLSPQQVYKVAVVGNPTMLHLFAGISPASIAVAPFTPVFTEMKTVSGRESLLAIHPLARVFLLPSLSGYVGADITAGLAATPLLQESSLSLFLDIGTNGEMALGNRDEILCCATAAGPAFEGGHIRCGMGAVSGAICAFRQKHYETLDNQKPIGICGSGLLDLTAALLDSGTISPEGFLAQDVIVEEAAQTGNGRNIILTPQDVREVQLAKAAIAAGIDILLSESGHSLKQIKTVYLAGGFGNHLPVDSAVRIGLLPTLLKDKTVPIGNSAGAGAQLFLKSTFFEKELQETISRCRYVELSGRPDFNDRFADQLLFPTS